MYANDNLSKDGEFGVFIRDTDLEFQDIAAKLGFAATQDKEFDSFFYLDKTSTPYDLPEGFHITTIKETFDLYQYSRVICRGFNRDLNDEGELKFPENEVQETRKEMIRPNVDLNLKAAVVAPNGSFVSYILHHEVYRIVKNCKLMRKNNFCVFTNELTNGKGIYNEVYLLR